MLWIAAALALALSPLPKQDEATAPWTPLEYYHAQREAREAAAGADWARAVPLYRRAVEQLPTAVDAWRGLALGHAYLGHDAEAIAPLERYLELGAFGPANLQARLASCYARAGDADAAFRWLDAALASRLENRAGLASDPGLAGLKDDPRWSEVVGALPEREWSRDEGWRYDLDFLVREARRLHAGPTRPAFSERFAERAAALRASVPELSDEELVLETMRLVAVLNDGHSAIYGPDRDTPLALDGRALPLKLYWFPSGVYVVDGQGEAADLAGSRVLRFGDVDAAQVLERMAAYRGVDNAMTFRWMGPQFYLPRLAMLRAVGAASEGPEVALTLRTPEGEERSVTIEAGDFETIRKLRPSPAASGAVPRYLASVDTNYWHEPLPEIAAVYVQFNQVRDGGRESLSAFAARLQASLRETGATNLIVDVRHNNGGNNSLVRPLVRTLVEFDARSTENRIFVLTGRNTFSAAQNFINRVERWTDAIFVGEPSSSSPNFVGEETDVVLPYTRLRGSISSRYWQDSDPGDHRPWIDVDIPVELTAADYFENVDPVLDTVFELIDGA